MKRVLLLFIAFAALATIAAAQQQSDPGDNAPPPRSGSSSKDTKIDLRPPMGDAASHPNGGIADEVLELRPYDPHRAEKNIEIGDFYFKQKNYRAAESRYREALEWKPNDAIATFKLATTCEKLNELAEAKKFYESYLKILPKGPSAADSKKALDRLAKVEDNK